MSLTQCMKRIRSHWRASTCAGIWGQMPSMSIYVGAHDFESLCKAFCAKHCPFQVLSGPFRSFQVISAFSNTFSVQCPQCPRLQTPRARRFDNSAEMTHSAGEDGHSDAAELWPVDFCRWVYHRNDILRSGMIHLPNLYLATAFCSVEMIVDNLLEFAVWTTPKELESLANLEMPETWR